MQIFQKNLELEISSNKGIQVQWMKFSLNVQPIVFQHYILRNIWNCMLRSLSGKNVLLFGIVTALLKCHFIWKRKNTSLPIFYLRLDLPNWWDWKSIQYVLVFGPHLNFFAFGFSYFSPSKMKMFLKALSLMYWFVDWKKREVVCLVVLETISFLTQGWDSPALF